MNFKPFGFGNRPMIKLAAFLCGIALTASVHAQALQPYRGGPTPPLALKGLDGKTHNLRDYRGKVVMVQFWATYCPPCIKEMPSVERLEAKLADKPFVILAVNMGESEKQVRHFLNRWHIHLPVLLDPDGKALRQWHVFAVPSTFLIGRQGKIRYAVFGGLEWDQPPQTEIIARLLAADSNSP